MPSSSTRARRPRKNTRPRSSRRRSRRSSTSARRRRRWPTRCRGSRYSAQRRRRRNARRVSWGWMLNSAARRCSEMRPSCKERRRDRGTVQSRGTTAPDADPEGQRLGRGSGLERPDHPLRRSRRREARAEHLDRGRPGWPASPQALLALQLVAISAFTNGAEQTGRKSSEYLAHHERRRVIHGAVRLPTEREIEVDLELVGEEQMHRRAARAGLLQRFRRGFAVGRAEDELIVEEPELDRVAPERVAELDPGAGQLARVIRPAEGPMQVLADGFLVRKEHAALEQRPSRVPP